MKVLKGNLEETQMNSSQKHITITKIIRVRSKKLQWIENHISSKKSQNKYNIYKV